MKISKKNLSLLIENFLLMSLAACLPKDTLEDVKQNLINNKRISDKQKILVIDGNRQRFTLAKGNKVLLEGDVSTGHAGFGTKSGSGKTPTGFFKVHRIIGKGLKKGTVLIGLNPTKTILGPNESGKRPGHPAEVLTRAITLTGLDSDNKNTLSRNIYIHGTNREGRLGVKASGGCIRVTSDHAINLADNLLKPGDKVYISVKE